MSIDMVGKRKVRKGLARRHKGRRILILVSEKRNAEESRFHWVWLLPDFSMNCCSGLSRR